MIDDPFDSAEALFGMWQGFSNLQLALALLPSDREAWVSGRVARGIDLFLRAHAPAAPGAE